MSGHYKPELRTQAEQDVIENGYGDYEPWFGVTWPEWRKIEADIEEEWRKHEKPKPSERVDRVAVEAPRVP